MAAMICFNVGWQHMSILSQTIASMNYVNHHTTFANPSTFFFKLSNIMTLGGATHISTIFPINMTRN